MSVRSFFDTTVLVYTDDHGAPAKRRVALDLIDEHLLAAIDLHRQHALSIWDALVIRAAQRSGCEVLLTEDLQHGRSFDGIEIVNPFRG